MLVSNIFLGQPPANVKQWIIDHYGKKSAWDALTEKLESFDVTATPQSQGLPEVGSALTTKYMVCDGYMNGGTFVQCLTKQSVMDNIDRIDAIDLPWIVLGYNGCVPQYIKYKNGSNYMYVSSVDDSSASGGVLRAIAAGCKTYSRSWSDIELRNVFTDTGKTVSAIGSGTFKYGQTNANWGTTETTAGGWTVPTSIIVDGVEYAFCGYTAVLQSQYGMGSSTDGVQVTESTCAFSYNSSTSSGKSRWGDSHMRTYLNSRCGHNEITYPRVTPTANMLGFSNGIGLKLAKDTDFLKRCPPVVSRNWVHANWTSGVTLDSAGCEVTTNDFILLGNAGVNCIDNSLYYGNEKDEFVIWSSVYP